MVIKIKKPLRCNKCNALLAEKAPEGTRIKCRRCKEINEVK
tara:strand:- start:250 stop:372 length:123 start_codon:yes stop_codon:yes gene_type:complete